MRRIFIIAAREFIATVATRGFIIGWLLTPLLMTLLVFAVPRLIFSQRNVRVQGEVAVIDPTGVVVPAIKDAADPRTLERRRLATAHAIVRSTVVASSPGRIPDAGEDAIAAAAVQDAQLPDLQIVARPPDADLAREKRWLARPAPSGSRHLAVVVVHPQAATSAAPQTSVAYDLYVPTNLDSRTEGVIRQVLHDAIVSVRIRSYGLDLARLDSLTQVGAKTITLGRRGEEQQSAALFNRLVPYALIFFMFVGAIGGGQFLLTAMVEEKSNRVIEVLLSAVSPVELLAGKILGQLGASIVGMSLYIVVAVVALTAFALFGLVDPWLLFYLFLFFLISFLVIGSVMAGVGAAVNEMRDAQSLLAPFMILLSSMWVLIMPISLDPNSRLATTLSFTPIVNSFAMMVRMASSSPPPLWQVWLSIVVGLVSVVVAITFAARVFRIALLLHGRPPSLGTLIRWAMAS
jgi:ABC-2 type transport system permease protein